MNEILLINPNTSRATTSMMVDIAAAALPRGWHVTGVTAAQGVPMIVTEAELEASGVEVERAWRGAHSAARGVIVSAFGDPGIERVRAASRVPVVGLCEAAMLEAAAGGRRFGVATCTPELADAIAARAAALGLAPRYTGIRLTDGEPRALAADAQALEAGLAEAIAQCIAVDGAQAVIVGGGPLGQAALALAPRFDVPIVAPITAAVQLLMKRVQLADAGYALEA